MNRWIVMAVFAFFPLYATAWAASAVDELLLQYQQQGAGPFDPQQGEIFWHTPHGKNVDGHEKVCHACHKHDLTQMGNHVQTDKEIDPMAPSVNKLRLTDVDKIEKWLLRNCKWVLERECSPQEKGNILLFLRKQ